MYKKILVAVDGSDNSMRAAEHAAHIATLGVYSKVNILYILDYERTQTDIIQKISRDSLHADRKEQIALVEALFEKKNVLFELVLKQGDPGPTIVKFANEHAFDLVVVGSRGLNSFQEMILGSVSHKVAKRVSSPVLIVK